MLTMCYIGPQLEFTPTAFSVFIFYYYFFLSPPSSSPLCSGLIPPPPLVGFISFPIFLCILLCLWFGFIGMYLPKKKKSNFLTLILGVITFCPHKLQRTDT
jgi:hypothetical protein